MRLRNLYSLLGLLLAVTVRGAETNNVRTLFKGAFSGMQEAKQMAVTNQAGWEKVWQQVHAKSEPKEAPPKIDFEKETVLVVSAGQKNTGGYATEIRGIRLDDKKAVVSYHNSAPKAGALTVQAITAPVHIVAVPKISGAVEFKPE